MRLDIMAPNRYKTGAISSAISHRGELMPTLAFLAHQSVPVALLLGVVLSIPALAGEPTLTFQDRAETVRQLTRDEMAKLLPGTELTVENPSTGQPASYRGAGLTELLNRVYGERWKSAGLVKFVTVDGYQPVVTVEAIQRHQGLMAYADAGTDRLRPLGDGHGGTVDPGPFYLVWENRKDTGARTDPWLQWPWQLARVELTSLEREYPQTAPPAGASPEVLRGFNGFLSHCAKCHRVNGEGGQVGPELNYPVNVTEYWQAEWLPKFITQPSAIRHNSKMPPYPATAGDAQAEIRDILAYLRAMKERKLAPRQ
jgi:mono/diheme cytochrome c family protein